MVRTWRIDEDYVARTICLPPPLPLSLLPGALPSPAVASRNCARRWRASDRFFAMRANCRFLAISSIVHGRAICVDAGVSASSLAPEGVPV